jgi:uncharacterized membrane protein YbhN (UPF0104 family)
VKISLKKNIRKSVWVFLKIIVSILIFIFVIRKVTQNQAIDFFSILSFRLFIIIVLTGAIQISINALIQKKLLSVFHIPISFKNILVYNIISGVYVMIIPGFIAPDFYLGYQYSKGNKNYSRVISVLFLNRSIGLVTSAFLTVTAILILGPGLLEKIDMSEGLIKRNVLLYFLLGLLLLIMSGFLFFNEKISKIIRKISEIWNEARKNKITVFYSLLMKLGFNIAGLAGRLLLGYSVGVDLPVLEFAAIILVLNFLISMPVSFNGVGVREAGYVGLLSLMGVSPATALLFALSEFGISLFAVFIGGLLFFGTGLAKSLRVESSL